MLDVDHFKRFNDNYGHRVGDLVLRLVGRLLVDNIKGRDLAARYGGEEFAILLVGADLLDASKVARQICATLALKRVNLSTDSEQGAWPGHDLDRSCPVPSLGHRGQRHRPRRCRSLWGQARGPKSRHDRARAA